MGDFEPNLSQSWPILSPKEVVPKEVVPNLSVLPDAGVHMIPHSNTMGGGQFFKLFSRDVQEATCYFTFFVGLSRSDTQIAF